MASEKPPGLEQRQESEHEERGEESAGGARVGSESQEERERHAREAKAKEE